MKQGWKYLPIGEVADVTDFVANGSFATLRDNVQYHTEPSYAVLVRVVDFSSDFDKTKFVYVDKHGYDFLEKSSLQGGEIIMSNVGSIGKEFICPDLGIPMTLGPNAIVIRTDNNKYYYYCFFSEWFQNLLKGISGRGGLIKFNKTNFKQLVVPVPPKGIQDKIVEELDQINALIAIKEKQLRELEELEQTIFHEMFGDIIVNNKKWKVENLTRFCEVSSSKRIFANEYVSNGVPFYRGKEITELSKEHPISLELFISKERYAKIKESYGCPKIGDVLLTAVGTIGNIWVVDTEEPFYFKDGNIIWLKKISGINSIYLRYALGILINEFKYQMAHGCAYSALTIKAMSEMNIAIPPQNTQQEFANRIGAVITNKSSVKTTLKELQELLASRMQYWFD